MRKKILALIVLTTALISSCKKNGNDDKRILVVCTTGIISDTVKNIAGDTIRLITLMGSGIDPHLYKAKSSDLDNLNNAKIIFYNGLHLEAKLSEVLEKFGKMQRTTVAVAESIDKSLLIKTEKNLYDPHVWMSPILWVKVANKIKQVLIQNNVKHKILYQNNFEQYSAKLKQLHQTVIKKINSIPKNNRVLITAHDAFNYFGKIYNMKVRAIQGISTAGEASASKIKSLADFISKNKIPSIFLETTVSGKTIIALKNAVESRGHKVKIGGKLYSDALGEKGGKAGTYISMIKSNVNVITNGLK